VRVGDLSWMQLDAYLGGDDRIVLRVGSTEQDAYLSLETDNIIAERASVEAAEPLGVPVLPCSSSRGPPDQERKWHGGREGAAAVWIACA
jgi:creatinine amidohydrolase/Fe(II)-dependent formamide hydrolase-like protein